MALTHHSETHDGLANVNNFNLTVNVPAASHIVLVVFIAILDDFLRNITAVTLAGTPLTLKTTESLGPGKTEMWVLEEADMPAPGNRTLNVTLSDGCRILVSAHLVTADNEIIILDFIDTSDVATGVTVNLDNTGKEAASTLAISCAVVGETDNSTVRSWTNSSGVTEDSDLGVFLISPVHELTQATGHKSQSEAGAFSHVWTHSSGVVEGVFGAGIVLDEHISIPLLFTGFEDVDEFGEIDFDFITAIHYDGFEDEEIPKFVMILKHAHEAHVAAHKI